MSDFDAYQEQENEPEPLPEAALLAEPRRCEAVAGWHWITEAFGLFRRAPAMWLAFTLVYLALGLVLLFIPVVHLTLMVVGPLVSAGFYYGCVALERDEDLEFGHFFEGFRSRLPQLAVIGLLYLGAILVICVCILLIFGILALLAWVVHLLVGNQYEALLAGIAVLVLGATAAVAAGAVLLAMIAVWFAPQLVALHHLEPVQAIRLSFRGCARNVWPMLVLCLVGFGLAMLAVLPMLLGFLLWVPLWILASYSAYKDIFVERKEKVPEPTVEAQV